jgi:hypothetical protein
MDSVAEPMRPAAAIAAPARLAVACSPGPRAAVHKEARMLLSRSARSGREMPSLVLLLISGAPS